MTNDAGVPGAPRFDVVLRGYDRRQVDEHVDRLQRVLARMRNDLEIVRSQPMPVVQPGQRPDPNRPRPTPRPRPGAGPDTIGNFTDRMQSFLAVAEAEAAEIRRNAHAAARAETEGVRSQVADLMRQRDGVLGELTRMRSQLEGMLAAPTTQMAARPPQGGRGGPPPPDHFRGAAPAHPQPPQPGNVPSAAVAPQAPKAPTAAPEAPGSSGDPRSQVAPGTAASPAPPAALVPTTEQPAASAPVPSATPSGPSAGPSSSGQVSVDKPSSGRAERGPGKASHRLPTGAYPAVAESEPSSLRPRTEPQIEPADLFRPKSDGRPADPRGAPAAGGGSAEVDRTAMVPAVRPAQQPPKPGGAEATTVVGAVRPEDTTLLAQAPEVVARPEKADGTAKKSAATGPAAKDEAANGSTRNGSPSRSA